MHLTWPQVLAWRMRRQFLVRETDPGTVEIARRPCGVQAQVASAAEQAVAVRVPVSPSGARPRPSTRTPSEPRPAT